MNDVFKIVENTTPESEFRDYLFHNMPMIFNNIKDDKKLIEKIYTSYIDCFNFFNAEIDLSSDHIPRESLLLLLDLGLINVSDIIYESKDGKALKDSELSSGQKCLILTMLNIAGVIADNCVICIDSISFLLSLLHRWSVQPLENQQPLRWRNQSAQTRMLNEHASLTGAARKKRHADWPP